MKKTIIAITLINLIYGINLNAENIMKIDSKITSGSIKVVEGEKIEIGEVRFEESNHQKINEQDLNFSPALNTQFENFVQNYITKENYTKEVKKYLKDPETGIESLVDTKIVAYSVEVPKTRNVTVNLVSTSTPVSNCEEWLPKENTVAYGEAFTQNRICSDKTDLTYDYFSNEIKIGTEIKSEFNNEQQETRTGSGSYLNLVTVLSYTGAQSSIRRTEGGGCSTAWIGDTLRWYRASGDSCKAVLTDRTTGTDITYTLNPQKTTVIELQGYASTSYYSYFVTSYFGGLYATRDGSDFFGSACSNWWTTNCSLAAAQPRIGASGYGSLKTYKFIYSKGTLSYYIDDVLLKRIPFTTTGGAGVFAIGANSGYTYVSKVAVYEHQE